MEFCTILICSFSDLHYVCVSLFFSSFVFKIGAYDLLMLQCSRSCCTCVHTTNRWPGAFVFVLKVHSCKRKSGQKNNSMSLSSFPLMVLTQGFILFFQFLGHCVLFGLFLEGIHLCWESVGGLFYHLYRLIFLLIWYRWWFDRWMPGLPVCLNGEHHYFLNLLLAIYISSVLPYKCCWLMKTSSMLLKNQCFSRLIKSKYSGECKSLAGYFIIFVPFTGKPSNIWRCSSQTDNESVQDNFCMLSHLNCTVVIVEPLFLCGSSLVGTKEQTYTVTYLLYVSCCLSSQEALDISFSMSYVISHRRNAKA